MDRWIRRTVERALGDKVHVANAARVKDVDALVARLRPYRAKRPLRRFGPATDGGYLMPDDLDGIVGCLSPGVSFECRFDEEISTRGIDVFMADASVDQPPVDNPRFQFIKRFLDIVDSDMTITLDTLAGMAPAGELLLQMDIEGAEYRVLTSASPELMRRIRIAVIEFHDLDQMFSRFGFNAIAPVFDKLLKTHRVVHIHPNNTSQPVHRAGLAVPPCMEFTFCRIDRTTDITQPLSFPHPLDAPCVPGQPDVALPRCWQG